MSTPCTAQRRACSSLFVRPLGLSSPPPVVRRRPSMKDVNLPDESFWTEANAAMERDDFPGYELMDEFFDRRVDIYEDHMREVIPDFDAFYSCVAAQIPQTGADLTILDLGCGTGLELDFVLLRAPNARITAVDVSHEMLSRLLAKYNARRPRPNVTAIEGSYLTLSFPAGSFDYVISVETMHHLTGDVKLDITRRSLTGCGPAGSISKAITWSLPPKSVRFSNSGPKRWTARTTSTCLPASTPSTHCFTRPGSSISEPRTIGNLPPFLSRERVPLPLIDGLPISPCNLCNEPQFPHLNDDEYSRDFPAGPVDVAHWYSISYSQRPSTSRLSATTSTPATHGLDVPVTQPKPLVVLEHLLPELRGEHSVLQGAVARLHALSPALSRLPAATAAPAPSEAAAPDARGSPPRGSYHRFRRLRPPSPARAPASAPARRRSHARGPTAAPPSRPEPPARSLEQPALTRPPSSADRLPALRLPASRLRICVCIRIPGSTPSLSSVSGNYDAPQPRPVPPGFAWFRRNHARTPAAARRHHHSPLRYSHRGLSHG